jgi:D-alanine--poly(phosphoribitol) ligase subunit 2
MTLTQTDPTRVPLDPDAVKREIHSKVVELAKRLGVDARDLSHTDNIPEKAGLDSAAIMELIVWYEMRFNINVEQDDLTMNNFGTVQAMADYLHGHGAA